MQNCKGLTTVGHIRTHSARSRYASRTRRANARRRRRRREHVAYIRVMHAILRTNAICDSWREQRDA